jgi:hypothetical protein
VQRAVAVAEDTRLEDQKHAEEMYDPWSRKISRRRSAISRRESEKTDGSRDATPGNSRQGSNKVAPSLSRKNKLNLTSGEGVDGGGGESAVAEAARRLAGGVPGLSGGAGAGASRLGEMLRRATARLVNQLRTAYMLSRSGHGLSGAHGDDGDESYSSRWVHRTSILVYVYEAILLEVLDYDFAPSNEFTGMGAVNMNVSWEAVDDLSDLQNMGLIARLKLATREQFTSTSYQVLPAGIAALRNIKQEDKDAIDAFLTQGVLGDTPATLNALAKERFTHGSPFDVRVDAITKDFILVDPDGRERFRRVLSYTVPHTTPSAW